jgi:hypothetical protein
MMAKGSKMQKLRKYQQGGYDLEVNEGAEMFLASTRTLGLSISTHGFRCLLTMAHTDEELLSQLHHEYESELRSAMPSLTLAIDFFTSKIER